MYDFGKKPLICHTKKPCPAYESRTGRPLMDRYQISDPKNAVLAQVTMA